MSFVIHVRWYTKYTQTIWDVYYRASIEQCPLSYMSNGIQSTHRLPGMSTVGPVSGNVLCHTCPMVYKVHTDYLGCLLYSQYQGYCFKLNSYCIETTKILLWTTECSVYNLPTFRLDALVILRAKVKRGAKLMAIYRRGSRAFALRMTRASSRNVGKLYTEH